MSVSSGEVEAIRGIWGTILARDWEAARDWALQSLRHDIVDPDLATPADGYVFRANAVPLGLMGAGLYGVAEDIYDRLIAEVDAFQKSSGQRRHRGALFANQAVCQILSGKFDSGVPRLIYTADEEDWKTFGPPLSVTPAMAHLRNLFEAPAERILDGWCTEHWLRAHGDRPSEDQFEVIRSLLGSTRWSFYSSILRTHEVWITQRNFPSSYATPRLVDGIRAICACLEHLAKSIGRQSAVVSVQQKFRNAERLTMEACFARLFGELNPPWWSIVRKAKEAGLIHFSAKSPWTDFHQKLKELLTWPASAPDELTARTLAISLLCRNFSSHETEAPAEFADLSSARPAFVDMVTSCATGFPVLLEACLVLGHLESYESVLMQHQIEAQPEGATV